MGRAGWVVLLFAFTPGQLLAQDVAPQLSFTVSVPEPRAAAPVTPQISSAVEERGLAIWSGRASDFNVAVAVSRSRWTIRSITTLTSLTVDPARPSTLQQFEIVRTMYSARSFSVGGGGGVREEQDGTRTIIGRVIAGSDLGRGRVQGSLVMERAATSPRLHRDAIDVVTTLGWSRPGLTDSRRFAVFAAANWVPSSHR